MCPQFNSFLEQLTVKENLQFIARIKGLSSNEINQHLELIVTTMDLYEFLNIPAKQLSGGNKRKLSCAMTMILSPHA